MDMRNKQKAPGNRKQPMPAGKPPAKKPAAKPPFAERPLFLALAITAITFLVFLPVFRSEFLTTWDDSDYILKNQMIRAINFQTLRQMFSSQVGGTYVPLPFLSYAIEYRLFGLSSAAFHFTNLLIHLFSTLFVFAILRRLGLKPVFAALGALLWGVHPMGVESVAWVTERKDLLYAFFYLASLIAYFNYLEKDRNKWAWLGTSCFLFLLALFSKIQAVSLPLVMLAVDYYRKRPLKPGLIVEKIPFFLLSLVFGIAGIFILKNIGALKVNEMYSWTERLFFGSYAFDAYLVKFIAPLKLSALYPYPIRSGQPLPAIYYISPLLFILLALAAWKSAKKGRAFAFAVLFFTLSVVFLLQIFGAGQGFMADRYTRIPYVGLVFFAAWGCQELTAKKQNLRIPVILAGAVFLVIFLVMTYNRTGVWKNGETLWTDVITKYPGKEGRPYACRGLYYKEIQEQDKALKDFTSDLALDPGDFEILQFRGNIYFNKGRDDSAYSDYIRALKIRQDNALTMANLGAIYVRRNQYDSAIHYLSKALQMDSTQYTAYANRAVAFGAIGRQDESIADFKSYLKSQPGDERVHFSIGMIYYGRGDLQESIKWFNNAISIKNDFANYYWMRSQAYRQLGNRAGALKDALKAGELGMQIPPGYVNSLK